MWVKGHPLFLLKTNGRSPPRAASSQTQIINSICIIRCIIRLWDQETCPFLSFFSIYLFTPSFVAGVGARRVVTSRVSVHVQALLTEGHLGAAGGSALTCICTQVPGSFLRELNTLTQNVSGPVAGNEAGVVSVAHAFLQDALTKVFAEAITGADQAVVPTVRLRESAQDSPGYQSAIRQYG